jgi:hypothetical protein
MNLEIILLAGVSVDVLSDGVSDALSLLDAIIGFASVENVFVAVMAVPEFALSIPLEELGCWAAFDCRPPKLF